MEDLLIAFLVQAIFFQYPAWRIYKRAGINPMLSITILIPNLGIIISTLILLFSKWQVQRVGGN